MRERTKASRRRLQGIVNDLKRKPCVDCGGEFPPVAMDFDHRDGEQKIGNISLLVNQGSEHALMKEIAKCDLVCSNCHRVRTAIRAGWEESCWSV